MKIGILALQGAFIEHKNILDKLGVENLLVKTIEDLNSVDAMILPGGESTAISKLLNEFKMMEVLKERIEKDMPVLGTCAGMILLAKELSNDEKVHLGTLDVVVKRNAYGRQLGSFQGEFDFKGIDEKIPMIFIRAPYVEKVGENVEILAEIDGNIVAVKEKNMLAISFHPELSKDTSLHEYFLKMVK